MTDTFLITAQNLKKSFGDRPAVDGVSIHVAAGEIYGLVGADGAGKTTTMRLIVGALKADVGECSVCGLDINSRTEDARAQLGYLSQRFSLYEDLTVLENIRFFAEVRGLKSREWLPRCMEILEFVGIASFKDRRAGQLSGGMKQKLGLASALVSRPRVLLLDEPTTGVDPVTRQDFWQLLIRLVSPTPIVQSSFAGRETPGTLEPREALPRGAPQMEYPRETGEEGSVAVLISTPYMDEAARCNRVGFMRHGKIIAEGTPLQLRGRLAERVLELRGSPLKLLRHIAHEDADVEDVRAFGDRLHIRVGEGRAGEVISRLPDRIRSEDGAVDDLRVIPPVLEDVFIELSEQAYE